MYFANTAGQTASMSIVQNSILISAPLKAVWQLTVEVIEWRKWCPTIQTSHIDKNERLFVGTKFSLKQPLQYQRPWQVTEFVPHQGAEWRTIGEKKCFEARHVMVERSNSVEVILQLRFVSTWRPLLFLMTYAIKSALRRENSALKSVCELST